MKAITLPLVSGNSVTLLIGAGHLAVCESMKEPGTCKVVDGLHNNGGWHIKMKAAQVVKKIVDLTHE